MLQNKSDPILEGMYIITYTYRMRTVFENHNSVDGRKKTNETRSHHLTSMPCTRNTHSETQVLQSITLPPADQIFISEFNFLYLLQKNEKLIRKRSMQ